MATAGINLSNLTRVLISLISMYSLIFKMFYLITITIITERRNSVRVLVGLFEIDVIDAWEIGISFIKKHKLTVLHSCLWYHLII